MSDINRRLFLGLAGASVLVGCAPSGPATLAPNSRLIVLRHADRRGEDLSEVGRARARGLVPALRGVKIDAIYAPKIQRNLDTAAPLALDRGLAVGNLSPNDPTRKLVAAGEGRTVVWVGNKTNLARIWENLSLPGRPPLDYGDLFFVTTSRDGRVRVKRRAFKPVAGG